MVSFQRMSSGVVCLALFLVTSAKADDSIPGPTRTIIVSSSSQLLSALNNAQPGDHIVLTNGSYPGFTVSRSGQIGKPIVIRAGEYAGREGVRKNHLKRQRRVRGRCRRNQRQCGYQRHTGPDQQVPAAVAGKQYMFWIPARSAIVDHNEIDSQATPTTRGWFGIKVDVSRLTSITASTATTFTGHRKTTGDDTSAILLGTGELRLTNGGVLVEYNLFMDWHGDGETICVKTSGHTIRFNTGIDIRAICQPNGHRQHLECKLAGKLTRNSHPR